ncbi:hypothetical protein [Tenacibaculum sp. M341]|uniref:hypothetical protein n=1 Tax=Tenacibaculum sp. M341 TaxID=2530339 RepID=UPI001045B9E0|nr:hypothetical protein [Tenacibaculum sp. M341]TCI85338.1 hypothetical protein EYW44_17350 [Tenacibaculum sp. M341]
MKIKIAFIALASFSLGINAQSFKTPDTNTDFNHLTRVGGGAAVYINQISSDSSFPILRLSSGIYEPNKNVRFTVENNGYVGIGTLKPLSKLSIGYTEGVSQIGFKRKDGAESFFMQVNENNQLLLRNTSGGGDYNFQSNVAGKGMKSVLFMEGANGNIGINTTTPTEKLDINGNLRLAREGKLYWSWKDRTIEEYSSGGVSRMIRFKNSMGEGQSNPDGGFNFTDHNGSSVMRINDFKVGIGTTNPKAKLDVEGGIVSKAIKTKNSNTDFNHFTRVGGGAAVYINQVSTDETKPILRLSSGIYEPNKNVRFTFENNGNLGIGTLKPLSKLSIGYTEGVSQIGFKRKDGAESFFMRVNENKQLLLRNTSGGGDYNFQSNVAGKGMKSVLFLEGANGNVGIGTVTPGEWKLAVNGKIKTKEIKVSLDGWSDFVFYDNYKLPTLDEVENHIAENGHLKDIPSAKEVEKNGIFLGEMDSKLLQKIEELTLYTIQQQKEIKALKKQNAKIEKQEKEIAELKVLVQKLLNK